MDSKLLALGEISGEDGLRDRGVGETNCERCTPGSQIIRCLTPGCLRVALWGGGDDIWHMVVCSGLFQTQKKPNVPGH